MILDKVVELRGHGRNRKLIESLGYEFVNRKIYLINVKDLMETSTAKVNVQCDYCRDPFVKKYWTILRGRETIEKDCCGKTECMKQKREEVTLAKYGVNNINKLQEVKNKIKNTNIEKYGVENVFQYDEFINKQKETVKEKYGVFNISQIDEVKNKKEQTLMDNYGVANPMQSSLLQAKAKETMLNRYGYEYAINIPENKEKLKASLSQRVFNPNDVRTSYTQTYLWNLFGGKLNYQLKMYNLDIALTNDKIYIEYDGSGHNLSVQLGRISEKDFNRKEVIRNEITKREGWKGIRIVALKDKIPCDDTLRSMFEFSKEYFATGHSWIAFDIEEGKVFGSSISESYKFGELFSKYKIKNKLIEYGIINKVI